MTALAFLVPTCQHPPPVSPDATVMIAGSVVATDGSPLARQQVRLAPVNDPGGGRGDLSRTLRGGPIGTETDDDGRYFFSFPAGDNSFSSGDQQGLMLRVSAPPGNGAISGAAALVDFPVKYESVRIPPLKLEDPISALEGSDAEAVARLSPSGPIPLELAFEADEERPLWQVTAAVGRVPVDGRILEDSSGRLVSRRTLVERVRNSEVRVTLESPGRPYAGAAGAPPSRGRPCRYVDGANVPRRTTDCSLTDGMLGGRRLWSRGTAVIDLAEAVPVELVVVRGCQSSCPLEISTDGLTFLPAGAVSSPFGAVSLGSQPIRALKVVASPSDPLTEVSVWGPRPASPALKQLSQGQRDRLARRFGDGGGVPWSLGIVAMLLLATVLTGTGLAAVSRRRRR